MRRFLSNKLGKCLAARAGIDQLPKSVLLAFSFGCLISAMSSIAQSSEFIVREAHTTLNNKVYYLNARIDFTLSDEVLEALHKGVPIMIKLEIEISRARDYLWDETITGLKQRYELEYHALIKQYTIKNLNSGALHSYPDLNVALSVLGTIADLPILDKNLLDPDEQYSGRIRAKVDINVLPVPLRLLAYLTSGWSLTSEWFLWSFSN